MSREGDNKFQYKMNREIKGRGEESGLTTQDEH